MKISKLFHYLYAAIMFLPLVVLPIFALQVRSDNGFQPLSIDVTQSVSIDFNQLKQNGDFVDTTTYRSQGTTLNATNNILNVNVDTNSTYPGVVTTDVVMPIGHQYYFRVDYQGNQNLLLNFMGINGVISGASSSEFTRVSKLFTSTANQARLTLYLNGNFNGQVFYLKNFMVMDVTQMFGGQNVILSDLDSMFVLDYYDYTLSDKQLVYKDITYSDTDVGSQTVYTLFKTVDNYFNFKSFAPFSYLYNWFALNFFYGSYILGFTIIFNLFIYWLFISLLWLLFDVFMYIPLIMHNAIDKARIE